MKDAKNEPSRAPTRTTGSFTDVSIELVRGMYRKRTQRIVDTEIETTVHDDSDNRGYEATVEAGKTVRGECLFIDINQAVKLASPSTLRRLGVIRKTGTGIVKGVDENER
jgi:hypothetical protein